MSKPFLISLAAAIAVTATPLSAEEAPAADEAPAAEEDWGQ